MNERTGIVEEGVERFARRGHKLYRPPAWFDEAVAATARHAPLKGVSAAAADILGAVATAYDTTVEQLISGVRRKDITIPRYAAYKLMRERLDYSFPRIAQTARLKSHQTIMCGLYRAETLLATDPEWAARYHAALALLDGKDGQ